MIGSNIVTDRVRFILQDTDNTAYIWSDAFLTTLLKDACKFLETRLPESMLTAPNVIANFVWSDITDLTSDLPFDERYAEALAYYMCWRALGQDGQDKRDVKRAAQMAGAFTGETGIVLTT